MTALVKYPFAYSKTPGKHNMFGAADKVGVFGTAFKGNIAARAIGVGIQFQRITTSRARKDGIGWNLEQRANAAEYGGNHIVNIIKASIRKIKMKTILLTLLLFSAACTIQRRQSQERNSEIHWMTDWKPIASMPVDSLWLGNAVQSNPLISAKPWIPIDTSLLFRHQ